jgi:hypothetical protein
LCVAFVVDAALVFVDAAAMSDGLLTTAALTLIVPAVDPMNRGFAEPEVPAASYPAAS